MIPCESWPTKFDNTSDRETVLAKSSGAPIPQITLVPISISAEWEYVFELDKLCLD